MNILSRNSKEFFCLKRKFEKQKESRWNYATYLEVMDTYGHEIAMQRSIEMAIKVLTDAETETPCIYETVLHIKLPNVHSVLHKKEREANENCQLSSFDGLENHHWLYVDLFCLFCFEF